MKFEDIFTSLQDTLSDLVPHLKPAPFQPEDTTNYKSICFNDPQADNTEWKTLISPYLSSAKSFEIHCWSDESEELALALQYGSIKPYDWEYGTVISGSVTPDFISFLLSLSKPANTVYANKIIPFFSIFLDNGFSSEHYGTENFIRLP